jgi:hypothetical protein
MYFNPKFSSAYPIYIYIYLFILIIDNIPVLIQKFSYILHIILKNCISFYIVSSNHMHFAAVL